MKKKICLIILCLVTGFDCTFGLVACGAGGTPSGTYRSGHNQYGRTSSIEINQDTAIFTDGATGQIKNYSYTISGKTITIDGNIFKCAENGDVLYQEHKKLAKKFPSRDGKVSAEWTMANPIDISTYLTHSFREDGTFYISAWISQSGNYNSNYIVRQTHSGTYVLENGILVATADTAQVVRGTITTSDIFRQYYFYVVGDSIYGGVFLKNFKEYYPDWLLNDSNKEEHNTQDRDNGETEGLKFEEIIENEETVAYSVVGLGTATDTDIKIPSEHNGLPVTKIREYAFSGCDKILSVTIPDSVTKIGELAFAFCDNLVSVKIGSGVNEIGRSIFSACNNLENIKVDSSNKKYHSAGNCIIETDSKTLVQGYSYSVIPTDGSVVTIGEWAFKDCGGLKSIAIPNTVKEIESRAFSGCSKLETIQIGNSVETIGDFAFWYCEALKEIVIPDSVIKIGNDAFAWCLSVKSIYIGKSVEQMATGTRCSFRSNSLESITVSNKNKTYHSEGNCLIKTKTKELILYCKNSIIPTDGSVDTISNIMYSNEYQTEEDKWLKTFTVPDCITKIGNYAFGMCDVLESIVVSANTKKIGTDAFESCTNLKTVYFKGSQSDWENIDIYEGNGNLIYATRYYYSETAPEKAGNYWHYDLDNQTPVKW